MPNLKIGTPFLSFLISVPKEVVKIMKINKFHILGKKKFGLNRLYRELEDNRKQPQIEMKDIARVCVEMVPLQQGSLLEVDQRGRFPQMRAMYKTSRPLVVSDTTISRRLPGLLNDRVRHYIYRQILRLTKGEKLPFFNLPKNKGLRVGVIDGSVFGNIEGSVLAIVGNMNLPIDFERSPGRGNELSVSTTLLKRANENLGKGFFDIIAGDGLYFTEGIIKTIKGEMGSDILIKTNEENLELIKDAKGLFKLEPFPSDGIERVEGIDEKRNISYRIQCASDFKWRGYSFKIAHIYEKRLKPQGKEKGEEDFFVITTKEDLKPDQMREIAHGRWLIENEVFKRLNSLVKSKRGYIRNKELKESLLLLWFVGLIIFSYQCLKTKETFIEWHYFRGVKITTKFLAKCMELKMIKASY